MPKSHFGHLQQWMHTGSASAQNITTRPQNCWKSAFTQLTTLCKVCFVSKSIVSWSQILTNWNDESTANGPLCVTVTERAVSVYVHVYVLEADIFMLLQRVPVNSSQGTSSLSHFFTFVTSSPCDDFTLWWLHCDESYDWCLLYSTLAVGVPCPSVAVVCWWRTRANQFWDDFFVIILCHILRLKCIKFDFDWGSTPDPAGRAYICSVPPDHLDLSGSTSKGREGKERGFTDDSCKVRLAHVRETSIELHESSILRESSEVNVITLSSVHRFNKAGARCSTNLASLKCWGVEILDFD